MMFISTNNDLHYVLLLLSSAGCIAISVGSAHNQFPFPCSNGYWNAAPIVYAIGAFYLVITLTTAHPVLSPKEYALSEKRSNLLLVNTEQ
ncbi:hypothetical protein B4900_12115 [Yersinia rohdei]|nr:hypothetical protein B4900_12115 [Yersinia rohdei]